MKQTASRQGIIPCLCVVCNVVIASKALCRALAFAGNHTAGHSENPAGKQLSFGALSDTGIQLLEQLYQTKIRAMGDACPLFYAQMRV